MSRRGGCRAGRGPLPPSRRAGRRRGERGASAVEFALVLPVLVLLVCGMIEFGLMYRTSLTFSDATRSAARVVAALPRTDGFDQAAAQSVRSVVSGVVESDGIGELVIYKADPATGLPFGGGDPEACSTNCWKYRWDAASGQFVVQPGATWPASSQLACGAEGATDYVGVYLRGQYRFVSGLFGVSKTLTGRAVMRLEPVGVSSRCRP